MKHGTLEMDGVNILGSIFSVFSFSSWISSIAIKIGCQEAALRLIISVHLGYPICIIYNLFLTSQPIIVKHSYYFVSGLFLCYFNYGINTFHSLVICLYVYTVLALCGGRALSIVLNMTFLMAYLLWGYYVTQTGLEYSFTWTISQCVLTLRLIALTFDVYDGKQNARTMKKSGDTSVILKNEDTAVYKCPTLLELLSHSYFPGSVLISPQVTYKNYIEYIHSNDNYLSKSWFPAVNRLLLGLAYLAIYQIGSLWWPYQYLNSKEFQAIGGFWTKATIVAIITKISTCKYMSGWLIAEGVIIISGASYDKMTNSFYSCSNVHVFNFETSPTFGGLIRSFNLTTNSFASKYIFKRLKWMGSKYVSQFITLLFLALWHGWSTGYYVTFGMEFLIMKMEWEVLSLVSSWRSKVKAIDNFLSAFYIRWSLIILFRIYTIYMFGYCLVPFTLLSFHKWYPVLQQLYFCGHIFYGSWIFISLLFFL